MPGATGCCNYIGREMSVEFLKHLAWLHVRIAIGRPDYRNMKGSYLTLMLFVTISLVVGAAVWLPEMTILDEQPSVEAFWLALAVVCAPAGMCMVLMEFHRGNNSLFVAFLGASSVVDAAILLMWGVLEYEPLHLWTYSALKLLWWYFCYAEFQRQTPEVRAAGYGLRDGEI